MNPTILLTGASGFLGTLLSPRLARMGTVVGISHSRPRGGMRQCDLTDRDAVNTLFNDVAPDIIVHAAALADVDACEREPQRAYFVNVEATRHIAEWAKNRVPTPRLLYISTDQVYDGPGPHKEGRTAPANVYALTKLWGEDLIAGVTGGIVLRTNFYAKSLSDSHSLVDTVIERARTAQPMTLFADVFFSPLLVDDLADVIVDVLNSGESGRFNAGASEAGTSKALFIRNLVQALNLPSDHFSDGSVADLSLPARRPTDMRMNSDALATVLGRPLPTVADGIARLAQSLQQEALL